MQEEKERIPKYPEISEHDSSHISRLQRRVVAINTPALSAWLVAANGMAGCKTQLEASFQRLSERLRQGGIYEDISMTDDGYQVIASTVGDLIFARRITAGSRTAQAFVQIMSDESIQQITSSRVSDNTTCSDNHTPRDHFKERFGEGRDLHILRSKEL